MSIIPNKHHKFKTAWSLKTFTFHFSKSPVYIKTPYTKRNCEKNLTTQNIHNENAITCKSVEMTSFNIKIPPIYSEKCVSELQYTRTSNRMKFLIYSTDYGTYLYN
jgi:hypothetical protein